MKWLMAIVGVVGFAWCACAQAQVYKCTATDGSVAYQDRPCARGQRQALVDVPSRPPPGYVPPSAGSAPPDVDADAPAPPLPAFVPPPAPLPELYACVGAVNGKRYLTRNPPGPYLAPLGAMGYPPQSLAGAYGAPDGAGVSAPEVAPRPRIGGPRIGAGMVEVQDACMPAPRAEVCDFVQREYDENHARLRRAMPGEQPPYEQRERELEARLRSCR